MQELTKEIQILEKEILEIHREAESIVHDRPDLSVPLTSAEAKIFAYLERECASKQRCLKVLKHQLANAERGNNDPVELTEQEVQVLTLLQDYFPTALKAQQMSVMCELNRARIYEHMRTFIVAGYVHHKYRRKKITGYIITKRGQLAIQKNSEPPNPQ